MNTKKIIIIAVFVIIIIGVIYSMNNKKTEETDSQQTNKESENNIPEYNGSVFADKQSTDPQTKLTMEKSWYGQEASEFFSLFDGYTNADAELRIINKFHNKYKTTADIEQLLMAYGTDKHGYTFTSRLIYEGIDLNKINSILLANGCDYKF